MLMTGLVATAGVLLFTALAGLLFSLARFLRRAPGALCVGEAEVLGAWLEAALASVDWGTRVSLASLHADLGRQLQPMPARVRLGFRLGLWLYDRGPLVTRVSMRRFSRLDVERRRRVEQRLEESRSAVLAPLQDAIHALCLLVLCAQPEVLAIAGVDREPWVQARRTTREAQDGIGR